MTIITLTLPQTDGIEPAGTLFIRRGDLAQVHQFTYKRVADMTAVIADSLVAIAAIEADPPMITEIPPARSTSKKSAVPAPSEPTVDVPVKKGTKAVKISHIKITGGATDAAAYRQAVLLAGKLIDGKLWDGETPIRLDDVYRVAKKMKFLTAADFSLFKLEDFVQVEADSK